MNFTHSIEINAPRARVWATLADVEHWSDWTRSITTIDLLDQTLVVGSTARVVQPKLRPATYTVTECRDRTEFTWKTSLPGATVVANHTIDGPVDGPVTVTLGIVQRGPLSAIVSLLYGGLTREYVSMEAAGLKQICESS